VSSIDAFFKGLESGDRRCYLRVSVIRDLVRQPDVVRALLDDLGVPGKLTTIKSLSHDQMFEALSSAIDYNVSSKTSLWFGTRGGEVLAGALFAGAVGAGGPHWKKAQKIVAPAFCSVTTESALLRPVARWLTNKSMQVYDEVPMGTKRADVVGFRESKFLGLFAETDVLSVELKNEYSQLKRGLDQLAAFGDYSTGVYLACTPLLAASYLYKHAVGKEVMHWDEEILDRRARDHGFGILIVEGDDVYEWIKPKKFAITEPKMRELRAAIAKRTRLEPR
jgi:hypothetical protein